MGFLFRKKIQAYEIDRIRGGIVNVTGDSTANYLHSVLVSANFGAEYINVGPNQNVIIAQDATQGIGDQHMYIVDEIMKHHSALVMVVFTNTESISDPELLELEELEFREFLSSVGMDGDAITFAYDSERVPISHDMPPCPVGIPAIIGAIKKLGL